MIRNLVTAIAVALGLFATPAAAAELVMFEARGCPYCAAWNREVAPAYARAPEAVRAPLRRVDLHGARPPDLAGISGVRFTPTFVLVEDGREIGRIEGYAGEDFFWGLLTPMMERLSPAAGR